MALPGDDMVQRPHFNFTRAITIQARPEEIWPWLVQIGYGRAGWYSYDLLDNLGRPSAEQLIPELQQLQVGDWVSMGGKPRPATAMRVKAFQPNRWLLWEHQGCPWVWVLKPIDQETTRLLSRGRNRYTWRDVVFPLGPVLMELGDPFMMRRQLHNLKRRAEQLATARRSAAGQEGRPWTPRCSPPGAGAWRCSRPKSTSTGRPEAVFDHCSDPPTSPSGTSR